jgi:hypothetical protein
MNMNIVARRLVGECRGLRNGSWHVGSCGMGMGSKSRIVVDDFFDGQLTTAEVEEAGGEEKHGCSADGDSCYSAGRRVA